MNERKCYYCGSEKYYAKGLCMPCYTRLRRNGTLEYKQRGGRPITAKSKEIVRLKTSGIKEAKIAKLVGVSRQDVYGVLSRYYRPTNLDRIREMNAEELADFIGGIYTLDRDAWGDYDPCVVVEGVKIRDKDDMLDWLKQEVDSGPT